MPEFAICLMSYYVTCIFVDYESRDEIAGCSEKAYDYLTVADAKQIMMFSSDQELADYIAVVCSLF